MELATGTIFLAGLATFASPCVLPMIPIYLSVLMGGSLGEEEITGRARGRLMLNGLSFVIGFSLVFVLLGLTATALGSFLLTNRLLFQQIGGLVVFVFGLKFLGWLHIAALEREKRFHLGPGKRLGPIGALVMGFTFAFGWTPCIGPVLGAILTFTAVSTTSIGQGAVNLLAYAAGIGLPLLVVAAFAGGGVKLLNRMKRFIPKIEKATGVVLVAMGVMMVTDSTSLLTFGIGDDSSAALSLELADKAAGTSTASPELAAASGAAAVAAIKAPGHGDAGYCDGASADGTCGIAGQEGGSAKRASAALGEVEGQPRVVYFHQPNCPSCLKMAPVINAMQRTCSGQGLLIQRVDVSHKDNRALASTKGVRGTPTLLFVDGGGQEVARLVGAAEIGQVHDAVSVLVGTGCADFTTL